MPPVIDDIHNLAASEYCNDVVNKGINAELDVLADIIETSKEIPYVGSLIKLFNVGASVYSYCHNYKKLAHFLKHALELSISDRKKFVESWDTNMRKKAAEYIISVLNSAEDSDKADVLGLVYKARLLGRINDEMLLRLTSIVNRIYIRDLRMIDSAPENTQDLDNIISNFSACGIIKDKSGSWQYGKMRRDEQGSLACHFNSAGKALYDILKKEEWFANHNMGNRACSG